MALLFLVGGGGGGGGKWEARISDFLLSIHI